MPTTKKGGKKTPKTGVKREAKKDLMPTSKKGIKRPQKQGVKEKGTKRFDSH
jgi:hypothetical protein